MTLITVQGTASVRLVFTIDKQTELACDVLDTFATHAGLIHDTDKTDCWAQNGNTQGCFHKFQTLIFHKKRPQFKWQTTVC